jgi:hypothetical protein
MRVFRLQDADGYGPFVSSKNEDFSIGHALDFNPPSVAFLDLARQKFVSYRYGMLSIARLDTCMSSKTLSSDFLVHEYEVPKEYVILATDEWGGSEQVIFDPYKSHLMRTFSHLFSET